MQMTFETRRSDDTAERRRLFLGQLDERLVSRPASRAALTSHAPIGGAFVRGIRVEGRTAADVKALPIVSLVRVGPRYFDVVGARVIAGRVLGPDDRPLADDAVVVNERFAQLYFENQPVVGRRILLVDQTARSGASTETRWTTIIGVVDNIRQRTLPSGDFDPVVYESYTAEPPRFVQIVARSVSGAADAATFVREQMRTLDADLPVFGMATVDELLASQQWVQRLFVSLFGTFALIAMLLATCGQYAVTSYAVSRRTREIGVRVTLGADGRSVWWSVTRATLWQFGIGLVLGTAGAIAVATVLPAFLVGTGGANPTLFAVAVVALVAAGLIASAIPARRAVKLDPIAALQVD
jgi:ABC-type antimicrobial peptide transport system permease subunit